MEFCLQKLMIPNSLICDEEKLYFRHNVIDSGYDRWDVRNNRTNTKAVIDELCIKMKYGDDLDFSTYFNSFSILKWKKYTNMGPVSLTLDIKGKFIIEICEGSLYNGEECIINVLKREAINNIERKEFIIEIPNSQKDNVFFRIKCISDDGELFGGSYISSINKENINNVKIALVICTFKKESYIKKNLELLNNHFFHDYDAGNGYDVIVVDNGQTLIKQEIENEHIHLFPNINTGGSGGFTRGMIEALESEKKYTHVLFMDDDVSVNVDSFVRTYNFLTLLKEDYKKSFLGGTMLRNDKKYLQHEAYGVRREMNLESVKDNLDLREYRNVIFNDIEEYAKNKYAGWWYCCIPTSLASLDNLPLPFFIRGDDEEYSLRNTNSQITLNGISVWHEAFDIKYSTLMEGYFVFRNSLVINCLYFNTSALKVIKKLMRRIYRECVRYDYSCAELVLDALDDFMKGISFYKNSDTTVILKEKGAKQNKVSDFDEKVDILYKGYVQDTKISVKENVILKLFRFCSLNGFLIPSIFYKNIGYAEYGYMSNSKCYYKRKKVVAVDFNNKKYVLLSCSKIKFIKIGLRMIKSILKILFNYNSIKKQFRDNIKEIENVTFWKKYLKLD